MTWTLSDVAHCLEHWHELVLGARPGRSVTKVPRRRGRRRAEPWEFVATVWLADLESALKRLRERDPHAFTVLARYYLDPAERRLPPSLRLASAAAALDTDFRTAVALHRQGLRELVQILNDGH